jgi:hypothetical protein
MQTLGILKQKRQHLVFFPPNRQTCLLRILNPSANLASNLCLFRSQVFKTNIKLLASNVTGTNFLYLFMLGGGQRILSQAASFTTVVFICL